MANQTEKREPAGRREPVGFTTHSSGPASERAREQGWQTNEEERTGMPQGKQNEDGGTDYDYGARDFGDEPVDTSAGTSAGNSSGTNSGTSSAPRSDSRPESSAGVSPAQSTPGTPKKEKPPAAKPRSKKSA